jgi:hypothetical protein
MAVDAAVSLFLSSSWPRRSRIPAGQSSPPLIISCKNSKNSEAILRNLAIYKIFSVAGSTLACSVRFGSAGAPGGIAIACGIVLDGSRQQVLGT